MLNVNLRTLSESEPTLRPLTDHEIDAVAGGVTFDDAFETFIAGGALLGQGAAMLVAGAYTGLALTPALVLESLGGTGGLLGGIRL